VDHRDGTSTLPAAPITRARQPRILVVEDDRHVRTLLRDLLATWGYEVDAAANGREGLALFDPGLYDVVLTDFAMPELSGLDVVAGLRERDRAVPVIMFTGSLRDLDGEGRRLGFRVLHKPLDIDGLRQVVRESLGSTQPI
jgi:DNA-binding response OmpR family regulator